MASIRLDSVLEFADEKDEGKWWNFGDSDSAVDGLESQCDVIHILQTEEQKVCSTCNSVKYCCTCRYQEM